MPTNMIECLDLMSFFYVLPRPQNSSPFDRARVLRNVIESRLKKLVVRGSYIYILVLK